jgi:hypothetical protein
METNNKMKFLFSSFLVLYSFFCYSQKNTISIEAVADNDKYNFKSVYYPNQVINGSGQSLGFTIKYDRKILKWLNITAGTGYYNYNFDIERNFNYGLETQTNLGYATKKYAYHCLPLSIGIESKMTIQNYTVIVGVDYINYITFGQKYTPYGNVPQGPEKKNESYYFGKSILLSPGISRNINDASIGLKLRIPASEKWKKDEIFKENQSEFNKESFHGLGLSLSVSHKI